MGSPFEREELKNVLGYFKEVRIRKHNIHASDIHPRSVPHKIVHGAIP